MNRPPSFQYYPKDWRDVKVRRMSLAAQGAYRAILDDMWVDSKDQCSVLDCDPFIAKSLGISIDEWLQLRKEIQHDSEPLLIEKNGRLYSKRLKEEAIKQRKYSQTQADRARKRWDAVGMPPHSAGNATGYAKSCSSSSILIKKEKEIKTPAHLHDVLNGQRVNFDLFWTHYPKKRGKGQAEKVWAKLQPDDVLLRTMLSKIEQAKLTPDWQKENGQFVPHPATWLNGKGWTDEFAEPRKERIPL